MSLQRPALDRTWERSSSDRSRNSRERLVTAALVAVLVATMVAIAAVGAWKYFRISAFDDYRAGYAIGSLWRAEGTKGNCQQAMEDLYGPEWNSRSAGWGEFRIGCLEGASGDEPASWISLRTHLWPAGD